MCAVGSSLLHLGIRKNSFLEGVVKPLAQATLGSGGMSPEVIKKLIGVALADTASC